MAYSVTAKALNVPPIVVLQPYNITYSGANATFKFDGKFVDYNNKQTFTVNYTNSSDQLATYDFTYIKIKSLLTANQFSQIYPTPTSITAQRCQIQNFNISFSNVQYGNPWENPPIGYGTVTNYEYLLPSGWKLGNTPSNGSNWIADDNSIIVTSDLSSGDGGVIRIRPSNIACAAGLITGQEAVVSISRPAPSLYISSSDNTICSGCQTFTINGMPSGATVQWSVTGTDASISGCSTCTTVNVCRNTPNNASITLQATVKHCTFTYTKQYTIILGSPPQPRIQQVTYYGNEVGLIALFIPDCNYNWYEDNILMETGGNTYITSVPCNTTKFIQVEAVNNCGISIKAGRGVAVSCGGGQFTIAPNPVQDNLTIKANNTEVREVRIADKTGRLRINQKYSPGTKLINLNITWLEADIYVVQIFDGKGWENKKIIVQ